VDDYYFSLTLCDWSKKYKPVNNTFLDIPTALAFFGDYKKTRELLEVTVSHCVEEWNNAYGGLPIVST
jgi:hypothetical protein